MRSKTSTKTAAKTTKTRKIRSTSRKSTKKTTSTTTRKTSARKTKKIANFELGDVITFVNVDAPATTYVCQYNPDTQKMIYQQVATKSKHELCRDCGTVDQLINCLFWNRNSGKIVVSVNTNCYDFRLDDVVQYLKRHGFECDFDKIVNSDFVSEFGATRK